MTRLQIQLAAALAGLLLVLALLGGLFLWGREVEGQARDLEAARDEIDTRERIDRALHHPPDCPWPERLRGAC